MESLPKSASIKDVATRAGVSPATTSRALTGRGSVAPATRERVLAAAAELGYAGDVRASGLVTGRSQAVGVIMPTARRWFFGEVLDGIQSALIAHQNDLVLYDARPGTAERDRIFDFFLARNRLDGIIAIGIEPSARELERLARFGIPLVSVGGYDIGTGAVSIDDENTARIATEHLLDLGHEKIAFVGGDPDGRGTSYGDARRLDGYRAAMTAAGHPSHIRHIRSDVTMPSAYHVSAQLLADRRTRPTAILAVCDEVAIGAIIAARRLGIGVPSDLSVIGIDDHENAEMFSLSTMRQDPRWQGEEAVRLVMDKIARSGTDPETDGDDTSHLGRTFAPSTLIIRASTGALS